MAKKPSLTPRERKTVTQLAKEEYQEAVFSLEALMEHTSILQDLLYYRGLGVKIPQNDINTAKAKVEECFIVAMENCNNTTAKKKKRVVVSLEETEVNA